MYERKGRGKSRDTYTWPGKCGLWRLLCPTTTNFGHCMPFEFTHLPFGTHALLNPTPTVNAINQRLQYRVTHTVFD
ncbi:hypothetical protein VNO78_34085 [Psophocarpus tetragonolobus]|uniref:Uncharacterized protein n=1 Tax=Psophocarpus tetragonolobus TaxID=3891 RepID=A0AAN9P4W0_PSOTE